MYMLCIFDVEVGGSHSVLPVTTPSIARLLVGNHGDLTPYYFCPITGVDGWFQWVFKWPRDLGTSRYTRVCARYTWSWGFTFAINSKWQCKPVLLRAFLIESGQPLSVFSVIRGIVLDYDFKGRVWKAQILVFASTFLSTSATLTFPNLSSLGADHDRRFIGILGNSRHGGGFDCRMFMCMPDAGYEEKKQHFFDWNGLK